ncbi:MAG: geranylgeranyl reductase family protein [Bacteroidetes bacterium]|nr:geranylgeranyl reductase family protein [Bacteroidota bacterium]
MIKTDVCIVGAGPGGCGTALKLSYLGIPCVLVDKAKFPRDKVCGDAISGKVTTLLKRLDPEILKRFDNDKDLQIDIWGIKFVAPNMKEVDIPYKTNYNKATDATPGHVSKRRDFDYFLVKEVQRRENVQFFEETAIKEYEKTEDGFIVSDSTGEFTVACKILIVANGAHSSFTRKYAGLEKDMAHHAGAVRAYYENVGQMHEDNFIELHFVKEIIPGYFWIFPLPGGHANVGLGMRSDFISKRKFNLREEMENLIATHPTISKRFENAERVGKVAGYGLPLGSKKRIISGDHFMLVGDAGHLIDPFSGEGIGNAFYSGFIAAEQAATCLEENKYSADFMRAYDVRVARVLGSEMRLSYHFQRMVRYGWLINLLVNWTNRNRVLIDIMSRMYSDFTLRKQLINPMFWFKLLFRKNYIEQIDSKKRSS